MKGDVKILFYVALIVTILYTCYGFGEKDPQTVLTSQAQFKTRKCKSEVYQETEGKIKDLLCQEGNNQLCPFTFILECHKEPRPKHFTIIIQQNADSKPKPGCHGSCLETQMEATFEKAMERLNSFEFEYSKTNFRLGDELQKSVKISESCSLDYYLDRNRICIPCENGYFSPDGTTCKPKHGFVAEGGRKSRKKGREENKDNTIKGQKAEVGRPEFKNFSRKVATIGFVVPGILFLGLLVVGGYCLFVGRKAEKQRKAASEKSQNPDIDESAPQETLAPEHSGHIDQVGDLYMDGYGYHTNEDEHIYQEIY